MAHVGALSAMPEMFETLMYAARRELVITTAAVQNWAWHERLWNDTVTMLGPVL